MPTLNLFTNIPVDPVIASDILRDATKVVAKIIGKPESVESIFYLFPPCLLLPTKCLMKLLCKYQNFIQPMSSKLHVLHATKHLVVVLILILIFYLT